MTIGTKTTFCIVIMHSYIKDFKIANILHINILSICWGLLKKNNIIYFSYKIFGIIKNVSIFAAYFVLYEQQKMVEKDEV